jgi:RNA polymerase sigma factor (sigma-70 family)
MIKDLDQIVERCRSGDAMAQKGLYDSYKSILFGICRRYINNNEDAEDTLVLCFVKIFSHINDYKNEGSFEGWMKKITVNESLMQLRKRKVFTTELEIDHIDLSEAPHYENEMQDENILALMDQLPDGCRAVLNLYAVEGFKHREIADQLNISINTSKSQLILARKKMRELIEKRLDIKNLNQD